MAAPLTTSARIALVGLGNMGSAIAERILAAKHPLSVFNRSPGRDDELVALGATRLGSLRSALAEADVVLTSLTDDDAVESAVCGPDGILSGARAGTVLVETSTISIAASERVAAAAAKRGVEYLRAPFSGNPVAIRSGNAAVFVSGPSATAEECRPLLEAIGPTVRYVGEDERARALKLALQVMIGGTAALLAEALVLGESAGLERKDLLEAIAASAVGSRFVEYKTGPLLADDYSATFTTAMMVKDVGLVQDLARATGAALPLTDELRALLESTCEHGHADEDFISLLLELQRRSAGVAAPAKGKESQ
jgi:3-hydroxyisobutyrate dehydrogenase-like beta-hydroxyacid dehydrogenase